MMPYRRSPAALLLLPVACVCNIASAAPHAGAWQLLFTDKVIACGAAAVALLVISLLLRGILKVLTLALVVVLACGAFWFVRDAWAHRSQLLPREWTALADETLENAKARTAWRSVQSELSQLSSDTQKRLAAGTDDARRTVLAKLEAKTRGLRKEGNKTEAEQLERLAELIGKEK
jgi:hypothetical protein